MSPDDSAHEGASHNSLLAITDCWAAGAENVAQSHTVILKGMETKTLVTQRDLKGIGKKDASLT